MRKITFSITIFDKTTDEELIDLAEAVQEATREAGGSFDSYTIDGVRQWLDDDESDDDDAATEDVGGDHWVVDDPAPEPEDGDLVTKDYIKFYPVGGPRRVVVSRLGADSPKGWQRDVEEYMNRVQHWPNVWLEGERGGYDLLSVETGNFASES